MAVGMNVNELVLVQGMKDTRAALAQWNRDPWPVIGAWLLASVATAVGLLVTVYLIARHSQPDATRLIIPGVHREATFADARHVVFRNLLVLALHAMACVAGFMAGSALPQQAASRTGLDRWIHEKAGPLAIGFVVCATTFSLVTQAYVLGNAASTISAQLGISPAALLVGLAPHALPELTALFLPLAAWVMASRNDRWHELLAATVVTVAIALPVLFASSIVELYLSPKLLLELAGA
jgi:hypothetical protein